MIELSFLIDLFLRDDLPSAVRSLVGDRIKEIGQRQPDPLLNPRNTSTGMMNPIIGPQTQAPSTLNNLAKHGDIALPSIVPIEAPPPIAVIAHTPAAQAAIESMQQAVRDRALGKVDRTGRPRKF